MSEKLIRCPGFCIKEIKDKQGNITKLLPGYLELIIENGKPTSSRLFCLTQNCPFMYRDEHNKDQWIKGEIPLTLPIQDPLAQVNI